MALMDWFARKTPLQLALVRGTRPEANLAEELGKLADYSTPELNYPQQLVGLARVTYQGEPGWIALDGARSRWYAAEEMPEYVQTNHRRDGKHCLQERPPDQAGRHQPCAYRFAFCLHGGIKD